MCRAGCANPGGKISRVQIGMLGPFEVRTDDGVLADVPGARLRGLLIALALEPGRVVPKATLVDWIWGEQPPVRRGERPATPGFPAAEGAAGRVGRGAAGRLPADGGARRRRRRAVRTPRRARPATTRTPQRVRRLREALALWRGAAMQDVGLQDSAAFDAAVTRLEGLRLTAMEDRFDAEISLGHGAELVTELTDLVAAHPVRERLVAALMRALVASRSRHRGAARVRAHEGSPGRRAGRRPLTGAVRAARRAAAGRVGTAGGEPEDQPACRADQLRRQGRRRRRGPRAHRRASAHHPDRAGRLGEDQAGHGDRAHAARRPAGRGLAGGARGHRRRR